MMLGEFAEIAAEVIASLLSPPRCRGLGDFEDLKYFSDFVDPARLSSTRTGYSTEREGSSKSLKSLRSLKSLKPERTRG
jgi:hypothetical protein